MVVFFVRFVSQLFAPVQDVRGFQKSEAGRVSVSSANHALKIVRSALRDAFRDGSIDTNPAERVRGIKGAKAAVERRPFTMPELEKLLEIASGEWRGLILFAYYTGQIFPPSSIMGSGILFAIDTYGTNRVSEHILEGRVCSLT